MRLAFDVGKVRIGVAASDRFGILASPVATLQRQSSQLNDELIVLINEYSPVEIVVGLPSNLRGAPTESTRDAIEFGQQIQKNFGIPTYLVDERMSTVQAAQMLRMSGKTSKNSRHLIDQQAACVILESALGNLKSGMTTGIPIDEYQ